MDDEIKGEGNSVNYTFRMHDPRVGRFFARDPLTKNYPFYSPYAFSGNNVIQSIELEGLEPESIMDKNGKLTKPIIALLSSAYAYDKSRLQNVAWISSKNPEISQSQKFHFFTITNEPAATVFYESVIFDDSLKEEGVEYWMKLVAHEQSHQQDMVIYGDNVFYIKYGLDAAKHDYRLIPTEKKAYTIGDDNTPLLLNFQEGKVLDILNSDLTETEKTKQMEVLGAQFRRDVIMQNIIDEATKIRDDAQRLIKHYEDPAGGHRNDENKDKMLRIYKDSKRSQDNKIRKAKRAQKQITDKYNLSDQ